MDGAHGLPKYVMRLANEIQQVLHGIGKQRIVNEIKSNSAYRYDRRVIQQVNK